MPEISATPDIPDSQVTSYGSNTSGVKVATPDIILFNEETLPADLIAGLIFEGIGSQEIITISRNDIINGQDVSYNLIGNLKTIGRQYNTKNIFSLPDTSEKYFKNFAIRLDVHVPEEGTGPPLYKIGEENSRLEEGCFGFPIINKETNELVGCQPSLSEAKAELKRILPPRPKVYIVESGTDVADAGDLVIDVTNMEVNERVDVEVLRRGTPLSDTIYTEES